MEPIKELEECVDVVFNNMKLLNEEETVTTSLVPDTTPETPLPENPKDDLTDNISTSEAEFKEGDLVKIINPEDTQLDGTEWIYDGPSDSGTAKIHSKTDDTVIEIDYSKIQKISTDDIDDTKKEIKHPTDSLNLEIPESKSIEDAVMSVLEAAPAVAGAVAAGASASAGGAGAAIGSDMIKGMAATAGQQAMTAVQNKAKETAKEMIDDDSTNKSQVVECDETNKECPKCQSSPCKCENKPKKRSFVTKKNLKESFEAMKIRKLAEAKEKGFSLGG